MTTFDTLQKHQILNCGDMKKDGKENPNITNDAKLLFNYASNFITGINCEIEGKYFEDLKQVINSGLLEHVKKYCFGTLLPIPEYKFSDNKLDNITFINKNSRKVVPINVTNAFIDAAMDPSKYFLSHEINNCETPASNIDPGSRGIEKHFYPNISAKYPLKDYGFREGSTFNYIKENNKGDYKYIQIILDSKNYFEGLVDRTGKIGDEYSVCLNGEVYNQSNSGSYSDIFKSLFQGNSKKNNYVIDNKDSKDVKIKMLCTLLIFFKELGDTTQPIVIRQLFGKEKLIKRDNTCLLTIDTILACRCALLNVPYLLNSSSIITYYAAIDEANYKKNMKLSEIQKTKMHNEAVIKEYEELLDIIKRESNKIMIKGAEYSVTKKVIKRFENIIKCIGNANLFLDQLKQYLESGFITTILSSIGLKSDYKELTETSVELFRYIVQSLQALSIFVYRGKNRAIISGKYYVFPKKLLIKEQFFTWDKDCFDSITFQDGVANYISVSSRDKDQTGGTKEIDGVDFQDNEYNKLYCYSLLYPYIYCNPYLLPYILKKKEQELIDFLNKIIGNILLPDYNDIIPESISDKEINNLYSEELLYYLDDSNKLPNMYQEIDNYEIYTNKLLEKLDYFVNPENNQDISVLLEAKLEDASPEPAASSSEDIPAPAASSSEDLSDAPAASSTPAPNLTVQTNLTTDIDIDTSPPLQTPPSSQIPRPLPQTPHPLPIKKETSQGKRQRLNERQYDRLGSPISFGGRKKTKNKNKKVINKKTKKKYKSKLKIVYKKKNIKKRITKKKKTNKKVKNTKKNKK
jgi:hypothetical protein